MLTIPMSKCRRFLFRWTLGSNHIHPDLHVLLSTKELGSMSRCKREVPCAPRYWFYVRQSVFPIAFRSMRIAALVSQLWHEPHLGHIYSLTEPAFSQTPEYSRIGNSITVFIYRCLFLFLFSCVTLTEGSITGQITHLPLISVWEPFWGIFYPYT